MKAKLLERIKEQLLRHEGLRLKPCRCTALASFSILLTLGEGIVKTVEI